MRRMRLTAIQRWCAKVRLPLALENCWDWTAGRFPNGYGEFGVDGKGVRAHRYGYERLVGSIPVGLQLDHLCRNRGCVNPMHLEPVTRLENTLRGVNFVAQRAARTHCKYGHDYSWVSWGRQGRRRACLKCSSERQSRRIAGAGL